MRRDTKRVSSLGPCSSIAMSIWFARRYFSNARQDSQKSKLALWLTKPLCQMATSLTSHLTRAVYSGV